MRCQSVCVIATQAAYNEGEKMVGQLIEYLHANYLYMRSFARKHLPEFLLRYWKVPILFGWIAAKLGLPSEELERQLMEQGDLWLNAGIMYGMEGEGFMRWNIACPRTTLIDGFDAI